MVCPSCHTLNRDNAKFCKKCRLQLVPADTQSEGAPAAEPVSSSAPATPLPVGNRVGEKEETASAVPAQDVSAQSAAVGQTVPASSSPSEADSREEDIALAPTQILSPEKMVAYQSHRWQQEVDRDQQPGRDVAEMPTLMIDHVGGNPFGETALPLTPAIRASNVPPDIAEMPTVLITPGEIAPPPPLESQNVAPIPSSNEENGKPGEPVVSANEASAETQVAGTASSSHETVPSPTAEEDAMEQIPSTDNNVPQDSVPQQPDQQVPAPEPPPAGDSTFTPLAVGTLVADRYEITQVLGEDPTEYIYSVTDHQGYQHCWNCGSEENASGDEFCITCGAELLNAVYTMHEYPPESSGDSESHVLQGNIVNTFLDGGLYVSDLGVRDDNCEGFCPNQAQKRVYSVSLIILTSFLGEIVTNHT